VPPPNRPGNHARYAVKRLRHAPTQLAAYAERRRAGSACQSRQASRLCSASFVARSNASTGLPEPRETKMGRRGRRSSHAAPSALTPKALAD
jgi:hypothetical protein